MAGLPRTVSPDLEKAAQEETDACPDTDPHRYLAGRRSDGSADTGPQGNADIAAVAARFVTADGTFRWGVVVWTQTASPTGLIRDTNRAAIDSSSSLSVSPNASA